MSTCLDSAQFSLTCSVCSYLFKSGIGEDTYNNGYIIIISLTTEITTLDCASYHRCFYYC